MSVGMLEAIETLVLFVAFTVFVAWVWSPGQKARFEEASWLPLREDDGAGAHAARPDGGVGHE